MVEGGDVEVSKALVNACLRGDRRQVKECLPQVEHKIYLEQGIWWGACRGHADVINEIIEHDASVINTPLLSDGVTPLMIACHNGEVGAASLLSSKGASIYSLNSRGACALDLVLTSNAGKLPQDNIRREMILLLLKCYPPSELNGLFRYVEKQRPGLIRQQDLVAMGLPDLQSWCRDIVLQTISRKDLESNSRIPPFLRNILILFANMWEDRSSIT